MDIQESNLKSLHSRATADPTYSNRPINCHLKFFSKMMTLEWEKRSAENPKILFSVLKNLMQRMVQRKEVTMVSTEQEVRLEQTDCVIALQQTHVLNFFFLSFSPPPAKRKLESKEKISNLEL